MDLKEQFYGTEIEMTGITRKHAAEVVSEMFGTSIYHRSSYDSWCLLDREGKEWKFVSDSSINPERRAGRQMVPAGLEYCTEMVSPKLAYGEMGKLQEVVRCLRRNGARVNPSCGQHYASPRIIEKILKKPLFYQTVLSKSFHNNHSQYLLSQSRSDGLFRYSIGTVSGTFTCSFAALSASWRCLLSIRAYTSVVFMCSCPSWSRM